MAEPIRISEQEKIFSMAMGERRLIMQHGDIVKLEADAVVCPVDPNLDFRSGIAKVISQAAGRDIRAQRPIFPEPLGKVVVLPGGNMKVKYIFLTVLLGETQDDKMRMAIRQAVNRTIRYAEFLRLKSLAFPVLGHPRSAPSYSMIAREMLEDVTKYFQRRNTKLKLIHFSVFNSDAYSIFCREAKNLSDL